MVHPQIADSELPSRSRSRSGVKSDQLSGQLLLQLSVDEGVGFILQGFLGQAVSRFSVQPTEEGYTPLPERR
jgi:hypothetical protein